MDRRGTSWAAAGADLDAVYRAEVDVDGIVTGLTLPRDCEALGEEITVRSVGLLILDPLLSAIGAGIDTHRDRELRQALEPLARMADRTGCAVVGPAHFTKSASPDPLNLITAVGRSPLWHAPCWRSLATRGATTARV